MLPAIDLLDMAHHFGESPGIGFDIVLRKRGQLGGIDAGVVLAAGKVGPVGLDPGRHVGAVPVLPGGKPDEDQLEMALTGGFDDAVGERKIEFALLGFHQFPGEAGDDGVEVQRGQTGPDGLQVGQAGGAGIVQFAREHDPRVAIDDELGGRARPSQVGNAGLRRSAALQRRKDGEEDKRNGDRQGSRFHLGWLEGSVRVILIGRLYLH